MSDIHSLPCLPSRLRSAANRQPRAAWARIGRLVVCFTLTALLAGVLAAIPASGGRDEPHQAPGAWWVSSRPPLAGMAASTPASSAVSVQHTTSRPILVQAALDWRLAADRSRESKQGRL